MKFEALVKVVNFVYDGKVVISKEKEGQDFVDAYNTLKINLGKKVEDHISNLSSDPAESDIEPSSQESLEFKCANCNNKDFPTRAKLMRHVRDVHRKGQVKPKPKPEYKCESCNKSYTVLINNKSIIAY